MLEQIKKKVAQTRKMKNKFFFTPEDVYDQHQSPLLSPLDYCCQKKIFVWNPTWLMEHANMNIQLNCEECKTGRLIGDGWMPNLLYVHDLKEGKLLYVHKAIFEKTYIFF